MKKSNGLKQDRRRVLVEAMRVLVEAVRLIVEA